MKRREVLSMFGSAGFLGLSESDFLSLDVAIITGTPSAIRLRKSHSERCGFCVFNNEHQGIYSTAEKYIKRLCLPGYCS